MRILIDQYRQLADDAADRVSAVAAEMLAGNATLQQLGEAFDVFRHVDGQLAQLERQLTVQGRVYILRRRVGGAI